MKMNCSSLRSTKENKRSQCSINAYKGDRWYNVLLKYFELYFSSSLPIPLHNLLSIDPKCITQYLKIYS